MVDIVGDPVSLAAGAPVLIVGFTHTNPFDDAKFCKTLPDIVLAGRLAEPYVPGHAFLLLPGPFARSVRPRGFRQFAVNGPTGAFIALRHRHLDEFGAYMYFVVEDSCRINEVIESVHRHRGLRWPDHLVHAKLIAGHVDAAYFTLDLIDRALLRA